MIAVLRRIFVMLAGLPAMLAVLTAGTSYLYGPRAETLHDSLAPPGPRFYGEAVDGAVWPQTAALDRHLGSIAADSRTTECSGAR